MIQLRDEKIKIKKRNLEEIVVSMMEALGHTKQRLVGNFVGAQKIRLLVEI